MLVYVTFLYTFFELYFQYEKNHPLYESRKYLLYYVVVVVVRDSVNEFYLSFFFFTSVLSLFVCLSLVSVFVLLPGLGCLSPYKCQTLKKIASWESIRSTKTFQFGAPAWPQSNGGPQLTQADNIQSMNIRRSRDVRNQ